MRKLLSIILLIIWGLLIMLIEKIDEKIPDNTVAVIIKIVCYAAFTIAWIFMIGKINDYIS